MIDLIHQPLDRMRLKEYLKKSNLMLVLEIILYFFIATSILLVFFL